MEEGSLWPLNRNFDNQHVNLSDFSDTYTLFHKSAFAKKTGTCTRGLTDRTEGRDGGSRPRILVLAFAALALPSHKSWFRHAPPPSPPATRSALLAKFLCHHHSADMSEQ